MDKPTHRTELEAKLMRLTEHTLSTPQRYGHVLLVLFASTMAAMVAGLLLTENWLRPRAFIALSVLCCFCLAWAVFGIGVLRDKFPRLANREIVAARMAFGFTLVFTAGAAWFGATFGARAMTGLTTMCLVMLAFAGLLLVRAHRHRARLQALRQALERDLGAS